MKRIARLFTGLAALFVLFLGLAPYPVAVAGLDGIWITLLIVLVPVLPVVVVSRLVGARRRLKEFADDGDD